jgi:NitT/TauT family transport system ATP-binding protein
MTSTTRFWRRGGTAPAHAKAIPVSLTDVSKQYATRDAPVQALGSVSLDCAAGEFVSLLGPSGCGKTTILLMVAGLIPRTTGSIKIDGTEVTRPQTNLGFIFQDSVLLDWRKVMGNVLVQAELRGYDTDALRPRAQELLDLVGLSGFESRFPYELSGGMKQRVSICRALLHDPPLLMMDEPFGALDALTRDQLNLDLQHIWMTSNKTVLFVTHSITEAVFMSDRVVVMSPRPGKIETILEIDLPRPRTLSMRESPEFARYTREVRRVLTSLGILRDQ